jgi:hypothetical protein
MIINIGNEEHELNDPIIEVQFDIFKLNAIIAGLEEVRDKKLETLAWLDSLRDEQGCTKYNHIVLGEACPVSAADIADKVSIGKLTRDSTIIT